MKIEKLLTIGLLLFITTNLLSQEIITVDGKTIEIGTLEHGRYLISKSIGKKAPSFKLNKLEGGVINSTDYKNKVVLVKFWGLGCKPCMKSTKNMVALDTIFSSEKFKVIGIIPGELKPKHVRKTIEYLKKENAEFVNVIGSIELLQKFTDNMGIPAFFLIDKQGIIYHTHLGDFKTEEEFKVLKTKIEYLL